MTAIGLCALIVSGIPMVGYRNLHLGCGPALCLSIVSGIPMVGYRNMAEHGVGVTASEIVSGIPMVVYRNSILACSRASTMMIVSGIPMVGYRNNPRSRQVRYVPMNCIRHSDGGVSEQDQA